MASLLVGRDSEIAALGGVVDGLGSGRGGSVLIVGEPGIGKTALAATVRDLALQQGAIAAAASSWEAGGAPPFWLWTQVVRRLARDADADSAARARAGPGLAALLGDQVTTIPESGPEAEFRVFDAIVSFLGEVTRGRPLVVVLDDLQWADPSSIRAAEFVARHLALAPVLVISTCRSLGHRHAGPIRSLSAVSNNLALSGLDAVATAELASRAGSGPVTDDDAEAIHAWTGGNPFFIQEAIRAGPRHLGVEFASPGLRQILDVRVNELGGDVVSVLQTAALVGRSFSPALVASAMAIEPDSVRGALRMAEAAGMVRATTDGDASFVHDLVREALAAGVDPAQARAGHAAILRELRTSPHEHEVPAAVVAEHALLAIPQVDASVAVELLVAAATEARNGHSARQEAAFLRRAIEIAPDSVPDALRIDLGNALVRAGQLDEARAEFSALADQARGHEAQLFADAALGLHRVGTAIEGPESVVGVLADAVASLRAEDRDSPKLARMLAAQSQAITHAIGGDRIAAEELSAEAVDLARRSGDDATLGFCLLAGHDVIWTAGTAVERLALATEIAEIAARAGDVELSLLAGHLRVIALLELGRADARGEHRANAALARAVRLPRATYLALTRSATFATLEGAFERAEALIAEANDLADQLDEPDRAGVSLDQRWTIAFLRGRPEDIDDDMALARLSGDPHVVALEAQLAAQRGDAAAVAARVERIAELGAVWPRWAAAAWLVFEAQQAVAIGDAAAIERARRAIAPVADTWAVLAGAVSVLGPMRYWLGALAVADADWDRAIESFRVADEAARATGAVVWEVLARTGLVEALVVRGGPGDHATARASIDALRAHPLVADLADVGTRLAAAWESLEPTNGSAPTRGRGTFRREGDVWRLGFDGTTVLIPDAKGLGDLHTLLSNANTEIEALDLLHAGSPDTARASVRLGADPILDETARARFRERLATIEEELERALATQADDRAQRLDEERDALLDELRHATGLGGRRRRLGDESEKARKTVSARIRDTLRRLEDRHPALAEHLESSVNTGTRCSYRGDGSVEWEL